jgi:hypothetical protein
MCSQRCATRPYSESYESSLLSPHLPPVRSVLILSFLLRLGRPHGLSLQDFCIKFRMHFVYWRVTAGGWHFTGGFPMKLHREFLFRGFHGCNARVEVHKGTLYRSLTVFCLFLKPFKTDYCSCDNSVVTYVGLQLGSRVTIEIFCLDRRVLAAQ